jgi:cathepsin B
MTNGPVSATLTIYEDFLTYSGGVYKHQTGSSLGGHAIKIYGWGVDPESGLSYWICMNSWNPTWGINGTVLIAMDEGDINDNINAGL